MSIFDKQPAQSENFNRGSGATDYDAQPSAPVGDDPFDRVGSAQVSQGGIYVLPGVYPVLYVSRLVMKKSRKNDDLFIAEFEILKSDVPERPVGTGVSWICNLTKHDAAPGNVRGFLAALMGVSHEEVGANEARIACGPQNPCEGRLIRLEAVNVKTKAGGDFTACNWHTIGEDGQAQAKQLREEAGFPPF